MPVSRPLLSSKSVASVFFSTMLRTHCATELWSLCRSALAGFSRCFELLPLPPLLLFRCRDGCWRLLLRDLSVTLPLLPCRRIDGVRVGVSAFIALRSDGAVVVVVALSFVLCAVEAVVVVGTVAAGAEGHVPVRSAVSFCCCCCCCCVRLATFLVENTTCCGALFFIATQSHTHTCGFLCSLLYERVLAREREEKAVG